MYWIDKNKLPIISTKAYKFQTIQIDFLISATNMPLKISVYPLKVQFSLSFE